jgi:hypothetical protein
MIEKWDCGAPFPQLIILNIPSEMQGFCEVPIILCNPMRTVVSISH